jgi:hypothetical protein
LAHVPVETAPAEETNPESLQGYALANPALLGV